MSCRVINFLDKPSEPVALNVSDSGKDFVVLTWKQPSDDGGSPITGYVVEKKDALRSGWSKAGGTSSETLKYRVSKLAEGADYMFRVAAENSISTGDYVTLGDAVKATLPFGTGLRLYSLFLVV